MSQKNDFLRQVEVSVSGFFTTHHHFEADEGSWGELVFPAFSQHGVLHTRDGREIVMQKSSWLGSAHEFVDGDVVRGTADRRGLLSRDILLRFDALDYALVPRGILSDGWLLVDGTGTTLLELQPRGILREGACVSFFAPVDPHLVTFAYYLVHMRRQEDAAAVAATSAAVS